MKKLTEEEAEAMKGYINFSPVGYEEDPDEEPRYSFDEMIINAATQGLRIAKEHVHQEFVSNGDLFIVDNDERMFRVGAYDASSDTYYPVHFQVLHPDAMPPCGGVFVAENPSFDGFVDGRKSMIEDLIVLALLCKK